MRLTQYVAVLALLVSVQTAHAQLDLTNAGRAPAAATVNVIVASGPKDGANWKALDAIQGQIPDDAGVTMQPAITDGSYTSATLTCKGIANAAIVGRDAATYRAHNVDASAPSGCERHYAILSKGLFPYYLYAVVRANTPYSEFSDMISHVDPAHPWKIGAGDSGSGAHVTLHNLITSHPQWRTAITPTNDGGVPALRLMDSLDLDMVLVLDSHNSDYINRQVGGNVDAKGNPKFKVIEIRPYDSFFAEKDASGRHMYQQVNISGGWFHDVRTIATDGILIVNKVGADGTTASGFWRNHPNVITTIGKAVDSATADILSRTGTDPAWKPAVVSN
jgi:hypothetical protein